jgi:hypothetical protein
VFHCMLCHKVLMWMMCGLRLFALIIVSHYVQIV